MSLGGFGLGAATRGSCGGARVLGSKSIFERLGLDSKEGEGGFGEKRSGRSCGVKLGVIGRTRVSALFSI